MLELLRKGVNMWIVILCHGGKFALQVYKGDQMIHSKSDSKYVSRKKQGGRQLNADKTKNIMSSCGSQMRRENEKILQLHIAQFLEDAKHYLEQAELIFLHAPGLNKI